MTRLLRSAASAAVLLAGASCAACPSAAAGAQRHARGAGATGTGAAAGVFRKVGVVRAEAARGAGVRRAGSAPRRAGARPAGATLDSAERAVVRGINDVRGASGLPRVRPSRALGRAAEHHSRDMLRLGFFAHESGDGTPFARRVRRFSSAASVGEVLAATASDADAGVVVGLWMDSAPHRAILLSPSFRRIGVSRRSGMLAGAPTAVVTADFASG